MNKRQHPLLRIIAITIAVFFASARIFAGEPAQGATNAKNTTTNTNIAAQPGAKPSDSGQTAATVAPAQPQAKASNNNSSSSNVAAQQQNVTPAAAGQQHSQQQAQRAQSSMEVLSAPVNSSTLALTDTTAKVNGTDFVLAFYQESNGNLSSLLGLSGLRQATPEEAAEFHKAIGKTIEARPGMKQIILAKIPKTASNGSGTMAKPAGG